MAKHNQTGGQLRLLFYNNLRCDHKYEQRWQIWTFYESHRNKMWMKYVAVSTHRIAATLKAHIMNNMKKSTNKWP